jgi:hypothetical protein
MQVSFPWTSASCGQGQYKHAGNLADHSRLQRLHTVCSGLRTTKVASVLHILLVDPEVMFQVLPSDLLGWLHSLHLHSKCITSLLHLQSPAYSVYNLCLLECVMPTSRCGLCTICIAIWRSSNYIIQYADCMCLQHKTGCYTQIRCNIGAHQHLNDLCNFQPSSKVCIPAVS